jgi:AcrR family transcriptional regulator
MGVLERRARHKEELRQQILDAAREVFAKEGYESVSMRKIAQKIEYSPTTIYLYFTDKTDLLNCLCEQIYTRLARTFDRIEREETDPLKRLRRGLRAYIDFGLRNPDHYRVAFLLESGPMFANQARDESSTVHKAYKYLLRTVGECITDRKLRPADVVAVSQALWAGVHGLTSLLIIHPEFPWARRNMLIDTLLDGIIRGMQHGG